MMNQEFVRANENDPEANFLAVVQRVLPGFLTLDELNRDRLLAAIADMYPKIKALIDKKREELTQS